MGLNKNKQLSKADREKIEKWRSKHGCADFDFNKEDIFLLDGGLFSICKEVKIKPKTKVIFGKFKKTEFKGKKIKSRELKFIPIRKNGKLILEEEEYYKAMFWFEDLDETIKYLKSMKRLLNSLGFKTCRKF